MGPWKAYQTLGWRRSRRGRPEREELDFVQRMGKEVVHCQCVICRHNWSRSTGIIARSFRLVILVV